MRFLLLPVLLLPAPQAFGLTLEGTYERRTDTHSQLMIGDAVCFVPSAKFESALPRPAGDERRAWFCFSNRTEAMKALALPAKSKGCGQRGRASVVVSDYKVSKGEGESVDTARLERVVSKAAPRPIPCNE